MQKNATGIFVKIGAELFGTTKLFKVASTYVPGTPLQLLGEYDNVVMAQLRQQIA